MYKNLSQIPTRKGKCRAALTECLNVATRSYRSENVGPRFGRGGRLQQTGAWGLISAAFVPCCRVNLGSAEKNGKLVRALDISLFWMFTLFHFIYYADKNHVKRAINK